MYTFIQICTNLFNICSHFHKFVKKCTPKSCTAAETFLFSCFILQQLDNRVQLLADLRDFVLQLVDLHVVELEHVHEVLVGDVAALLGDLELQLGYSLLRHHRLLVDANVFVEISRSESRQRQQNLRADVHEAVVVERNVLQRLIELKNIALKHFELISVQIQVADLRELLQVVSLEIFQVVAARVDRDEVAEEFREADGKIFHLLVDDVELRDVVVGVALDVLAGHAADVSVRRVGVKFEHRARVADFQIIKQQLVVEEALKHQSIALDEGDRRD